MTVARLPVNPLILVLIEGFRGARAGHGRRRGRAAPARGREGGREGERRRLRLRPRERMPLPLRPKPRPSSASRAAASRDGACLPRRRRAGAVRLGRPPRGRRQRGGAEVGVRGGGADVDGAAGRGGRGGGRGAGAALGLGPGLPPGPPQGHRRRRASRVSVPPEFGAGGARRWERSALGLVEEERNVKSSWVRHSCCRRDDECVKCRRRAVRVGLMPLSRFSGPALAVGEAMRNVPPVVWAGRLPFVPSRTEGGRVIGDRGWGHWSGGPGVRRRMWHEICV
jgi:hypothetical protein